MDESSEAKTAPETAVADLLRATGLLLRRLRAELNHGGLTWSQVATLARLAEAGQSTTADLARAESVKPQSMGAALSALEQDGLIERRPHPTDGRQVLFALTERGVASRLKNAHLKQQWLSTAMEGLDPAERQTLVAAVALIKRLANS